MLFAFACAAMVIAAGAYVLLPLFREPEENPAGELPAETEADRLLGRKAVVEKNLKDLAFEYKLGRLAEADFQQLEAGYKLEAADIQQKFAQLGNGDNLERRIEEEIAAYKAKIKPAAAPAGAHEQKLCPGCGSEIVPGKKFCADCGWRF
jgi:hypothetical protein